MKPDLWKRLDKVAASMSPHTPGVVFYSLEDESDQEIEERVARWKAGEMVEGMGQPYTGREQSVWLVKAVSSPERDELC